MVVSCVAIADVIFLGTRMEIGGDSIGQPPYQIPKGKGTIAWRKSRRRREGAEFVDLQDLHAMMKPALVEAQFLVGFTVDPSAERLKTMLSLTSDIDAVTKPPSTRGIRTSEGRTGSNELSQRNERDTYSMLRRMTTVKCEIAYGARALW
jgi:hypothetical protein